jgi:hypothetical protein|tara:strand:+ start:23583 stop:23954 length:372 start_codon:yes stop_codon:yes gene_type:complete
MPEHIQLPKTIGLAGIKFVQAYIDDQVALLCGSRTDYHGKILEASLTEQGVPFDTRINSDRVHIPLAQGERYRAVGMGIIDKMGDDYHFWDRSDDYDLEPDADHLAKCQELVGDGINLKLGWD